MFSQTIKIQHPDGVHTRPASVFVREAGKFKSEITLVHEGTTVNGKSIMGILMLALAPGAEVTIQAAGDDEQEAVAALAGILAGEQAS